MLNLYLNIPVQIPHRFALRNDTSKGVFQGRLSKVIVQPRPCMRPGKVKWRTLQHKRLSAPPLRPAYPESDAFPPLMDSFTVDDLGGWSRVYPELVESLWQIEIEPRLDLEAAPLLLGN